MTRYIQILLCLSLLIVGSSCSEDTLDDFREKGTLATVITGEVNLDGYTVSVKGNVADNGGSNFLEVGFCYNEIADGEPAHHNEKTQIVKGDDLNPEFTLKTFLLPEREYYVRTYVINGIGISYGESKHVTTGELDYNLLLPGRYVARRHINYFSWIGAQNYYEDYEVSIKLEDGKLILDSLGCAPLGWNASQVSLEMELNHIVTDTTDYHQIVVPLQMTDVKVERENTIYPVLFFSSEWMLYGEATDLKDVTGKLLIEDTVILDLESGFTFAACDPITHEIDVNNPPLEIVVAPLCFEIKNEEDLQKAPKCRLFKKY